MKHASLLSTVVLLVLCLVLPCHAETILLATPSAITQDSVVTCADLIDAWTTQFDQDKAWTALNDLCEDEAVLTRDALLRLIITYYFDTYPERVLADLIDFEPSFKLDDGGGKSILIMNAMTHAGDITFSIDPLTGELLDSQANTGGNG